MRDEKDSDWPDRDDALGLILFLTFGVPVILIAYISLLAWLIMEP